MTKHYCGGQLIESTFFKDLNSCCDGMEMPDGCCQTEYEVIQHDDNTRILLQNMDVPTQVLLYILASPTYVELAIKPQGVSSTYLLSGLTVPDMIVKHQSFLL